MADKKFPKWHLIGLIVGLLFIFYIKANNGGIFADWGSWF